VLLLANLLLYSLFVFCVFSGCVCLLWLNVYVYVCLNMCLLCLCLCLFEYVSFVSMFVSVSI